MANFDVERFVKSILSMRFDENDKAKIKNWIFSRRVFAPFWVVQLGFYKAIKEQGLTYDKEKGFIEINDDKTDMSSEEKMALRAAIERSVAHLARTYGINQDEVWREMYVRSFEEV